MSDSATPLPMYLSLTQLRDNCLARRAASGDLP